MFEPYQPGKIPVVMVHGLVSSPLTWTTMFNDLRADPELRKHYQFWFYLYPSGLPYLETAADLRQTLARLRREVDPQGKDPALGQMVFVGHSMGGLVSRLLTEDSGNDFWKLVSTRSFDTVPVKPATRGELQRVFYFDRDPAVRRVVFIGTPHRGSKISPSVLGRVTAQFIRLPKTLLVTAAEVAKADPEGVARFREGKLDNSVDMLAPGSPALELLSSRPKPPGVHYHSIIGEAFGKGTDGSDGVVSYASAHLDNADSELVVPASHLAVHQHPAAVLEVKAVLKEHLRTVRGVATIDAPVAWTGVPPPKQ
jgi:pimeloyl-ACP methyl ester carboxylesterase